MRKLAVATAFCALALMGLLSLWQGPESDQSTSRSNLLEDKLSAKQVTNPQPKPPEIRSPSAPPSAPNSTLKRQAQLTKELVAKQNSGDFKSLVALAEANKNSPVLSESFRRSLKQKLPLFHIQLGWLEANLRNCDSAMKRFEAFRGAHPLALKGISRCQFLRDQKVEASKNLEEYLSKVPDDADALLTLADLKESQSDFEAAEKLAERALQSAQDPDRKKQAETYLSKIKSRNTLSQRQDEIKTNWFQLLFDPYRYEQLAEKALSVLEESLLEFVSNYGFEYPSSPIEVTLISRENFSQTVGDYPEWTAGLFDGRIRIPVDEDPKKNTNEQKLKIILRHELVHALFRIKTGKRKLPTWLEEGIAQKLECPASVSCSFQFPVSGANFFSKESFENSFLNLPEIKARIAYSQSLYMVSLIPYLSPVPSPLMALISGIGPQTSLRSDPILASVGLSFIFLHSKANQAWELKTKPRDTTQTD